MVHIKTGNDEIGKLKEGYNIMIQEIQSIQQTVEEQRIKEKLSLTSFRLRLSHISL